MKISIGKKETLEHVEIKTINDVIIEKAYTGFSVVTEMGEFIICARDGGIEVYFENKLVFSPHIIEECKKFFM